MGLLYSELKLYLASYISVYMRKEEIDLGRLLEQDLGRLLKHTVN